MRNRQDHELVAMRLESYDVGKATQDGSAYGVVGLDARPQGEGIGSARNPFQNCADLGQLGPEARPPFVVPQSCGSEFTAGFRMKNDPHAAAPAP